MDDINRLNPVTTIEIKQEIKKKDKITIRLYATGQIVIQIEGILDAEAS
jgi:hypothetical protein